MKVTLHIQNQRESTTAEIDGELSIGRTPPAQLILDDEGLSRVNTTIFVEGDEVLAADENSTNGTFLNGERISGRPKILRDGDRLKVGSHTEIRVEIMDGSYKLPARPPVEAAVPAALPPPMLAEDGATDAALAEKPPYLLIAAIAMSVLILVLAGIGLLVASGWDSSDNRGPGSRTPLPGADRIPVRVIDPLGGEDPDDLDDLIASWETEEDPLKAEDLREIDSASTGTGKPTDLNVSIEFWRKQLDKALNHGASGAEPAGLIQLPIELIGGNVSKQKAKLAELILHKGYKQPMDFGDLAQLKLEGNFLGELPMATESYVLDIGGSATGAEFTTLSFASDGSQVREPIIPGSPKYKYLKQLADDFDGQKYDLNNPADRKQMRIRLLRMYNKNSRKAFEELANAFYQQFKVPLRVTSLTRSMDYQIDLNKTNANSFKVSGKGSLPPHTSGCAFDVSRKNLTAEEQNFLMRKLAELEKGRQLDSLREGRANACFHSFIYPDGIEPTNLNLRLAEDIRSVEESANFPFVGFFGGF
ncbi:MAG: FHA domain-containing protein [Pyrinomonadaceae bacterium]